MRKLIFCCILSICCYNYLQAQSFCATTDTASDLLQQIPVNQRATAANNYVVRIFVHVMRRSNGTGGQNNTAVQNALNFMVNDFEAQGICISLLGQDEILNDTYYNQAAFNTDANGDGKFDNFSPNSHSNAIDIYLFGEDGNLSGGIAANIPGTALVIGGDAFGINLASSHVVSHELGHCLGLYHTFHGLCENGCAELVNGSNCTICGDFVCDTPPDPQTFQQNTDCSWNGVTCGGPTVDANGDPYNPAMNLIMAYIRPDCMELFTNGQGTRMRSVIANSTLLQNIIVPNSLTINSLSVGSGATVLYDVLNDITAQTNVVVNANGSLTLRAGESITLNNLFSANSSSIFHAYIDNACSTIDQNNSARANFSDSNSLIQSDTPDGTNRNLHVNIYPNPFKNKLNVDILSQETTSISIKIVSANGTIVKAQEYMVSSKNIQHFEFDFSGLRPGTYLISVTSNKNRTITNKIIKI